MRVPLARPAVPRMAHAMAQRSVPHVRAYSSAQGKACPSCGAPNDLAALQCQQCQALQPLPSEADYYDILGTPRDSVPRNGWSVDPKELKAQWRQKMAATHPDRLVARPDKEQQIGTQQSAIVNKAYETLLRPLPRALYLLEKAGVGDVVQGGWYRGSPENPVYSSLGDPRRRTTHCDDRCEPSSLRQLQAVQQRAATD